jgi:hypothetical protein
MTTPANWYAGPNGTGMNVPPPPPKQYDAAFFLDNEQRHIDTVGSCKGITTRKVPGSDPVMAVPLSHFLSEKYVQSLSPQAQQAAFVLHTVMSVFGERFEYYDFGSGIQQEDVGAIKAWVQEQKAQGKKDLALLFDWDRTLTFIEGFMPIPTGFGAPAVDYFRQWLVQAPSLQTVIDILPQIPVEAYVEYYVGGKARLSMLQELMAYLTNEGVDICILTNNPSCFKYTIPFEQMTMVVTNNVSVTFICAQPYRTKKLALEKDDKAKRLFGQVCKPSQGGKRKTRKRSRRNA